MSQTPIFQADSQPLDTLYDSDTMPVLYQTFASKNVLGDGSSVLVPHYVVSDGNGGDNYVVTTYTASGTINPAR